MKLVSKTDHHLIFGLTDLDNRLLVMTLSAYPVAKESWVGQTGSPIKEATAPDPKLLAEALQDIKRAHRQKLEEFLRQHVQRSAQGEPTRLEIPTADVEWFLQVVNEVCIGSWYELGCPDFQTRTQIPRTPANLSSMLRLEHAGMLASRILLALENRSA